jgi:hypothetical protein
MNGISMAEGVHQEWEATATGTSQDLADMAEDFGAECTIPGQLDCEVWKFADGSSIEIVWGGCAPILRDARGDIVP